MAGVTEMLGTAGALAVFVASMGLGIVMALERQSADVARALAQAAELTFRASAVVVHGLWVGARWASTRVRSRLERPRLEIHGRQQAKRRIPETLIRVATAPLPVSPLPKPAKIAGNEPVLDELTEPATPGSWKLPPINLFAPSKGGVLSEVEIRERARIIEETLSSFNIEAKVIEVHQGPTVTQFGLEPAPGVAVSRILARGNDLALRIGASPIRLEAPVPGKRMVGIEAPNATVSAVNIRDL